MKVIFDAFNTYDIELLYIEQSCDYLLLKLSQFAHDDDDDDV